MLLLGNAALSDSQSQHVVPYKTLVIIDPFYVCENVAKLKGNKTGALMSKDYFLMFCPPVQIHVHTCEMGLQKAIFNIIP